MKKQGPTIKRSLVVLTNCYPMAPMASHDHSKKKERNIPVLGVVLKPLYDFSSPLGEGSVSSPLLLLPLLPPPLTHLSFWKHHPRRCTPLYPRSHVELLQLQTDTNEVNENRTEILAPPPEPEFCALSFWNDRGSPVAPSDTVL